MRGLVERPEAAFLESLDDDPVALHARYVGLGRRHAEMGLPLPTFLKGADLLHEQLLEVLVHATREPLVLRDTHASSPRCGISWPGATSRWPARGPGRARRTCGAAGAALGLEGRAAPFACLDGLLSGIERHLETGATASPAGAAACEAARWIDAEAGAGPAHSALHGDAESLAFFLSRAEYAAVFPILEGLLGGRFHRTPLSLERGAGLQPARPQPPSATGHGVWCNVYSPREALGLGPGPRPGGGRGRWRAGTG